MIRCYLVLLSCQAAGEVIHRLLGVPLSGPIIGMILLLGFMLLIGPPSAELQSSARALLGYLSLLFVPAGVGIMRQLPLLRAYWLPIAVALLCSTILGMACAALTMQSIKRLLQANRSRAALERPAGVPTEGLEI